MKLAVRAAARAAVGAAARAAGKGEGNGDGKGESSDEDEGRGGGESRVRAAVRAEQSWTILSVGIPSVELTLVPELDDTGHGALVDVGVGYIAACLPEMVLWLRLVFGVWCLVFGVWCLVFGVWCLVFGVWCLMFGVYDWGCVGFGFGVGFGLVFDHESFDVPALRACSP